MGLILSDIVMDANYTCGNGDLTFSGTFPYMVSMIVLIIKIAVPILLIIWGMIDLGKAVVASKDEEIEKGKKTFIKRAITAIIVFFVIQVVQIVIKFVSNSNADVVKCFNCFVSGDVGDEGCKQK